MRGPLTDIKVLELSTMITGPLTGMMLADMGADVIKLENPDGGDPFRSYGGGGYSAQFCSYNRNKRSIAISLKTERGKEAFEILVARSDVLLDNMRAGGLARLGYDDALLQSLNPSLVRCSITGFGSSGPYHERPCYDAIAQALSGMTSQFLDARWPKLTGTTIADNVTGQYACYGILAALLERERTGVARRIDVNMLEATMAFMPEPFAYHTQNGDVADAYLRIRNSQAYALVCSDRKIVVVHLSSQDKFWRSFAQAAQRPDLVEDSRFLSLANRVENYETLADIIGEEFAKQPQGYWLQRLQTLDVPFSPANEIPEVFDDPQVRHLESFMTLEHRDMGTLTSIRRPVLIDGRRDDQPDAAPPVLGEHTEAVLREIGLAEDEAVD